MSRMRQSPAESGTTKVSRGQTICSNETLQQMVIKWNRKLMAVSGRRVRQNSRLIVHLCIFTQPLDGVTCAISCSHEESFIKSSRNHLDPCSLDSKPPLRDLSTFKHIQARFSASCSDQTVTCAREPPGIRVKASLDMA
jgi:hypothetical protein